MDSQAVLGFSQVFFGHTCTGLCCSFLHAQSARRRVDFLQSLRQSAPEDPVVLDFWSRAQAAGHHPERSSHVQLLVADSVGSSDFFNTQAWLFPRFVVCCCKLSVVGGDINFVILLSDF